MSVPENPKVDRSFTYDSVNVYYKFKIAHFESPSDLVLPTTIFNTPNELCEHLESVAKERRIPLDTCSRDEPYQWLNYIAKHPRLLQIEIWKYREYVYACSVLFIASYIQKHINAGANRIILLPSNSRFIPPGFNINEHTFTIVGSAELMSDIDITIQGPESSFIISLLEDLYIYMSYNVNIPIRCWDVEFYGDFKILQSLFVNMSKFNKSDRAIILSHALISYFRSSHKNVDDVSPIVLFLVKYCIQNYIESDNSPDLLIQRAYYNFMTEIPDGKLNRELFYTNLREVETMSISIKPYLIKQTNDKIVSNNTTIAKTGRDMESFSFNIFWRIMRGNVHRSESYIVPSTAVQVVEFEQKKGSMFTDGIPDTWFSSNARIGIDSFGYIISAIEQLGYLEHYHPNPERLECEKKGIKYFGRLIRALVQAGLLSETSTLVGDSKQLNIIRSSKQADCGDYNIHTLLNELHNTIEPKKIVNHHYNAAVTRRRRRTRRHTK
jgi:hypothetical protein